MKTFHIYILASKTRVLYIGVTSDMTKRLCEHKNKLIDGFTSKYNVDQLVYVESTDDAVAAISREKQLKGWLRKKKVALIEADNPRWLDVSDSWRG